MLKLGNVNLVKALDTLLFLRKQFTIYLGSTLHNTLFLLEQLYTIPCFYWNNLYTTLNRCGMLYKNIRRYLHKQTDSEYKSVRKLSHGNKDRQSEEESIKVKVCRRTDYTITLCESNKEGISDLNLSSTTGMQLEEIRNRCELPPKFHSTHRQCYAT